MKDFGPDFRTPLGLTPLMLAARAGNREFLEALLAQGADPEARDPFGYTPFLHALERALEEETFARERFPLVADLLAPTALDVQAEGHLVRLYPRMAEYWAFLAALASLKALALPQVRLRGPLLLEGVTAHHLTESLGRLPPALLPATLARKETLEERRAYLGAVLARSEVNSDYRPARRLFLRVRRGRYLPNPRLLLRLREGEAAWTPLAEVMDLEGLGLGGPHLEGQAWGA
ncbi:ankyrin repeat domain-containing protein [Thermus islandicus]|uniref:ankyrin repeat domain-containing protein n=1 Tax=Thermus islandicus TaxID=540988 RepID=UPI0003B7A1ED|nr:ankyrin repeat domain-containing protein [Thermus islandicus]